MKPKKKPTKKKAKEDITIKTDLSFDDLLYLFIESPPLKKGLPDSDDGTNSDNLPKEGN